MHGGRRYDRPGGGIPSIAQGMDARSDRCEVRAPGRSVRRSAGQESGVAAMRNSECGIGNEVQMTSCHEAAVVRSVERPGSSIDMHQPIPHSAFRVPQWLRPRPTSSEGQEGPALIMPGRHGGFLEPRRRGALHARRRARSGTGLAGLACSEARAKRQSRPVRCNVAVRR